MYVYRAELFGDVLYRLVGCFLGTYCTDWWGVYGIHCIGWRGVYGIHCTGDSLGHLNLGSTWHQPGEKVNLGSPKGGVTKGQPRVTTPHCIKHYPEDFYLRLLYDPEADSINVI